ncbi:hypothetical protein KPL74_18195 [Bacillus sp. NP157]|nr:hypothetical protein KPL74_18195 [Bacillus sp. NP157]
MRARHCLAFILSLGAGASAASGVQADRYFAVRAFHGGNPTEFVVRVTEATRAQAFDRALAEGRPVRLAARVVRQPAAWNPAWPFHTERHRLVSTDTLVARCPSHAPGTVAKLVSAGAQLQGSAWCPVVTIVREVRR